MSMIRIVTDLQPATREEKLKFSRALIKSGYDPRLVLHDKFVWGGWFFIGRRWDKRLIFGVWPWGLNEPRPEVMRLLAA